MGREAGRLDPRARAGQAGPTLDTARSTIHHSQRRPGRLRPRCCGDRERSRCLFVPPPARLPTGAQVTIRPARSRIRVLYVISTLDVIDGLTGLLVPARDGAALAGAMLDVVGSSAESQRLGEAACRRAREQFEVDEMVRRYEQLYVEAFDREGTDVAGRGDARAPRAHR